METLRYTLTIESPVCIAADKSQELSPYADYVLSKDQREIWYIDQPKLEGILGQVENRHLIETYTEALLSLDNNRSNLNLKSFLDTHLPRENVYRNKVKNVGIKPSNRLNVKPIIKSAGRPYIPGSTLKGVLRTALLYDWLQNTEEGNHELKKAYQLIEQASNIYSRLAPLRAKRRRRERMNGNEFRLFRDLEKQLQKKLKFLLNENEFFGKVNDEYSAPDSQHLKVRDTPFFEATAFGVYNSSRIRLNPLLGKGRGQKNEIPQPREALLQGEETSLEVVLHTNRLSHQPKFWVKFKQDAHSQLLTSVRNFSRASIGLELYYLEEAEDMPDSTGRGALIRFYDDLYSRSESGETFMRIGMGKTYFDNSLGLALMNYAEDKHNKGERAFKVFRELVLGVAPQKFFFPVTRTVAKGPSLPFGWIKIH